MSDESIPGWEWIDALVGPLDEDFERAVLEEVEEQHRPELAFFE